MTDDGSLRRDGRSRAVLFTDTNAVKEYRKKKAAADAAAGALNSIDALRTEVERLKATVEGMQKEIRCLQDKT